MRKKELETQLEFNKTIAEFAEHQKIANENFKGFMEEQYKFNKCYSEFLKRQDKFNKQMEENLTEFKTAFINLNKEYQELEEKYRELKDDLIGTDNLADKNGDYVRFLATTDKDGVRMTESQFTINIEYIKDGKLRYIGMDKKVYPDLVFDTVIKNEKDYAILSFKDSKDKSVKYYKVDKNTEQVVEVTDLIPAKEDLKKAGENLVNAVSSLASIFEPKTAKNVKKDTEKPAKNVGKKTTKKKESK